MTPLHQQMIDAMRQHGFSVRTHQSYLYAVNDLARHYRRSPEQLSVDELQDYFKHLVIERSLSGAMCRVYFHAVRFFYLQVLKLSITHIFVKYSARGADVGVFRTF
jgi:hypothetical protein